MPRTRARVREAMERLVMAGKWSDVRIAKRLKVGQSQVWAIRKKLGLSPAKAKIKKPSAQVNGTKTKKPQPAALLRNAWIARLAEELPHERLLGKLLLRQQNLPPEAQRLVQYAENARQQWKVAIQESARLAKQSQKFAKQGKFEQSAKMQADANRAFAASSGHKSVYELNMRALSKALRKQG